MYRCTFSIVGAGVPIIWFLKTVQTVQIWFFLGGGCKDKKKMLSFTTADSMKDCDRVRSVKNNGGNKINQDLEVHSIDCFLLSFPQSISGYIVAATNLTGKQSLECISNENQKLDERANRFEIKVLPIYWTFLQDI